MGLGPIKDPIIPKGGWWECNFHSEVRNLVHERQYLLSAHRVPRVSSFDTTVRSRFTTNSGQIPSSYKLKTCVVS